MDIEVRYKNRQKSLSFHWLVCWLQKFDFEDGYVIQISKLAR